MRGSEGGKGGAGIAIYVEWSDNMSNEVTFE